jgi:hypothetical protein
MKEQTLIETKNKVDALILAMRQITQQIDNLKDLSVGTLEILKNMPGYQDAVDQLKADVLTKREEKKLELVE